MIPHSINKTKLLQENIQIGQAIRKARKKQKLSQSQLALKINGHKNNISRIERGYQTINIIMFCKILKELNLSFRIGNLTIK